MVGFIFKIYQVWPFFLTSIILACDSISLLNGLSGLTLLPKPILYLTFTEISLKFALEPCSMTTYSTLPNAKVPAEAHTVFPVFSDPACLRTPLCPLGFNTPTPPVFCCQHRLLLLRWASGWSVMRGPGSLGSNNKPGEACRAEMKVEI